MSKKRVLQISHDYEMAFAGICARYVEVFDTDLYEVSTLYLRGQESKEITRQTGGAEVIYFEQPEGSLRGIKFSSIGRLLALCYRRRFDVVIAHRYKAIYLAGIASYFFRFKQVIGVVHEFGVFARRTRKLFVSFWRSQIKLLAVSDAVKNDVGDACPSLQSGGRVSTHHNCLDIDQIDRLLLDRSSARRHLGVAGDKYVFGSIGRLVGKKDHETLIKALAGLKDEDCLLVLIGSGSREDTLKRMVASLDLTNQVIFAGHQTQALQYLKAFDAFVMPSGPKEAFGMVLLEAMYAEIPIICSDAPGPMEVVGMDSLTFAIGNVEDLQQKMRAAMANPTDLHAQCERARNRVLNGFTPADFKNRFWQLNLLPWTH